MLFTKCQACTRTDKFRLCSLPAGSPVAVSLLHTSKPEKAEINSAECMKKERGVMRGKVKK